MQFVISSHMYSDRYHCQSCVLFELSQSAARTGQCPTEICHFYHSFDGRRQRKPRGVNQVYVQGMYENVAAA